MTSLLKYDAAERKVLALLASAGSDFNVMPFSNITRWTRLNRRTVRRCCRALARKGLAEFHRGCWTEDGAPAGSGYAATEAGHAAADEKLVERYVLRRWL